MEGKIYFKEIGKNIKMKWKYDVSYLIFGFIDVRHPTLVRRLPSGVSLSPPALSAFPLFGLSREPRSAVNRPSRDSKRSFVFPRGQQPNASLVFRNKADIQWGGGRR